ncbi:GntR family transcriptional regulator [Alkalicoccus daliensis]|uniref:DNA-binding transcriptional regulator, LacI/PurR family n=1 Tax=Alkalicoccus daliensis TaxID=745820 RepID=A0A1H0F8C1_9BACI|nr:GntR family transcriptional regulator [Alkalicoccus daliensis]SDN90894.1 DNA-binding transcriptional regulator, LacI/PurR family [Alkalicoccus daliensis]
MSNPFDNVKQSPRYEQIYSELKEKIERGGIGIGEKLPAEKELIAYYNVSRITTKKALDMLVNDKLIERIPGKGSFVRESSTKDTKQIDLSKNQTLIGYVVPDLDESHGLQLFLAIENKARLNGIDLILKRTHGDINLEKEAIDSLLKQNVAGLIILPVSGEYYNEDIVKLNIQKFPHVLVDRYLKGFSTTMIFTNNKDITKEAVNYLFDMNHRQIAIFSPPYKDTSAIEDRVEGFIQAYAERGILVNTDLWLAEFKSTFPIPKYEKKELEKDIELIKSHLSKYPEITAVFAMEYNIAVLAKEAAIEMGYRIPEDLSIICFDNPNNIIGRPEFTHIKQHIDKMAEKAISGIIARIKGEEFPIKTTLEAKLIENNSVIFLKKEYS